ncbi:hypothetical protein MGYG_02964 [Nannizzia gypsea CBS 118893]|uniref:Uncharacterized protein n=1 Tax=Arthroderma gypseum (strain ATCC MYA-4604 / CBS 118893) TaxID=535722 RepID=E4UQ37_ARTGP|nr:hypothetical protein MGYG_02964 [Nannizzia gypsea CBS 118893]EFQ99956.1 hypothetical protein MGYG_02964 [Nannizzia gypsea CBS 118893]
MRNLYRFARLYDGTSSFVRHKGQKGVMLQGYRALAKALDASLAMEYLGTSGRILEAKHPRPFRSARYDPVAGSGGHSEDLAVVSSGQTVPVAYVQGTRRGIDDKEQAACQRPLETVEKLLVPVTKHVQKRITLVRQHLIPAQDMDHPGWYSWKATRKHRLNSRFHNGQGQDEQRRTSIRMESEEEMTGEKDEGERRRWSFYE